MAPPRRLGFDGSGGPRSPWRPTHTLDPSSSFWRCGFLNAGVGYKLCAGLFLLWRALGGCAKRGTWPVPLFVASTTGLAASLPPGVREYVRQAGPAEHLSPICPRGGRSTLAAQLSGADATSRPAGSPGAALAGLARAGSSRPLRTGAPRARALGGSRRLLGTGAP